MKWWRNFTGMETVSPAVRDCLPYRDKPDHRRTAAATFCQIRRIVAAGPDVIRAFRKLIKI
jgi:hypothetical protein